MIDVSKLEQTSIDPATMAAQLRIKRGAGYEYKSPQGQMIGQVYAPAHPLQGLAEVLRGYNAGQEEAQGVKELQDIQTQRNEKAAKDMTQYVNLLRGTPEKRTEVPQQVMVAGDGANDGEMSQGHVTQVTPAIAASPQAAEALALSSTSPILKQLALSRIEKEPEIQARKDEKEANRQFRQDMLQQQIESRIQLAQANAANRPERMVTVLGPNGEAMSMPQSQAQSQGLELYNPIRAKQIQTEQGKKVGQTGLSETLDTLSTQYNKLYENNGIPSKDNRLLTNVGAAISSTGAGNFAGRMLGTENAEARDSIAQTRPLLLADIKKATGMTASEMNSNAELQMWLSAATDPTKGFEANMEAMRNLENKFGLGRGKGTKENPFAPKKLNANPAAASVVSTGMYNGRKVNKLSDGSVVYAD